MPKLENFNDFIRIDTKRYYKNELNWLLDSESNFIVYYGGQPERIIHTAPYDKWTDLNNDAYVSIALLTNDMDSFLFQDNGTSELDLTAFGELVTAQLTPTVQMKAIYGLFPKARTVVTGSGSAGAVDNLFFASSGAAINSGGNIFTRRQLHYRAGEGALARGTVIFDSPVAGSIQSWGLGSASDGFEFAYDINGVFGVQRRHDGHVIIQKLTITTPASGGENATITIEGTGYTVPLTAGTIVHNTNEIATSLNAQVSNWIFSQNNGFVTGRSLLANPATGGFSFSSSTAVGSFSEITAGVTPTLDFIPQIEWNIDKMDGSGNSKMTLNPQKGNVYAVRFGYLGFDDIHFYIKINQKFQEVHKLNYLNLNTIPSVSNPTFRINWGASNITNDTNITIQGASCAGFIEGKIESTEEGRARSNTKSIGVGTFTNVLTIRCRVVFGTNVNLSEVIPQLVTVFADTAKGAVIQIIKGTVENPLVLGGTPDFQFEDEANSIVEFEVDGTTVTGGRLVHSFIAGQSGEVDLTQFEELLLSGETLTIAADIISGSAANVTVTQNWIEEL